MGGFVRGDCAATFRRDFLAKREVSRVNAAAGKHSHSASEEESKLVRQKLAGLTEQDAQSDNSDDAEETVSDLECLSQQLNLDAQSQLPVDRTSTVPSGFDDFTKLDGIDVVIQQALQNAGYYEYADLQKADPAELQFIVSNFDRNLQVDPHDWSRQAAG